MNPVKRAALWGLSLALAVSLAACAAGPELPMEAAVDGHTVVLGRTTMEDLASWGYEVNSAGRQDVAHEGDKYIYFHYSLSKGAGSQFWVSVYTPYYGGANINREAGEAAQSGIVFAVTLDKSATEKISAVYNGVDIKDMTWDDARAWGAREKEDASKATWDLTAARGFLRFEAGSTFSEDLESLQVSMTSKAFAEMQK